MRSSHRFLRPNDPCPETPDKNGRAQTGGLSYGDCSREYDIEGSKICFEGIPFGREDGETI